MAMTARSTSSGKRGRPREFDRAQALERALSLFWRRGYEGTSIADLTAAMRVAPPSLYAAFGSKDKLFREAVELYVSKYAGYAARALAEEPTAYRAFARLLSESANEYASGGKPPGCLVASGLLSCAKRHAKAARTMSERRLLSRDMLISRLDRAVKDGELHAGADTVGLATFYAAVVQGMSVQAIDGATRNQLQMIAGTAMAAWPKKTS